MVVLNMTAMPRPRALDVVVSEGIEGQLVRIAPALLRVVDMEGDVDQTGGGELGKQRPRRLDAIGHQSRPHVARGDPTDDRDKLVALAQCWIAAGHLDVAIGTIGGVDEIDAAEDLGQRHVQHRFRRLGEVAQRAIEIAALGDLERDATGSEPLTHRLSLAPLAGRFHAPARATSGPSEPSNRHAAISSGVR
jgi:hypothetical protein